MTLPGVLDVVTSDDAARGSGCVVASDGFCGQALHSLGLVHVLFAVWVQDDGAVIQDRADESQACHTLTRHTTAEAKVCT